MIRFIQYYAKFLIWVGPSFGLKSEAISKLTATMTMFATTRKGIAPSDSVWRLGKQVEYFKNFQNALSLRDDIASFLTASKFLGLTLWLCYDALGLFHNFKIKLQSDIKLINKSTC